MTKGQATCKTCGVSGPPWHHVPTPLAPNHGADSQSPVEALHYQFIAALTYYADMVKTHPEKAHSLLNEGMVILEKAVTAYAATVEREARIDENEQELKFHMDITNSMYVKGFNDAVDQLIAYRDIRLAALQGPPS
jgi:hypothetical protein